MVTRVLSIPELQCVHLVPILVSSALLEKQAFKEGAVQMTNIQAH